VAGRHSLRERGAWHEQRRAREPTKGELDRWVACFPIEPFQQSFASSLCLGIRARQRTERTRHIA
jgi:hypothetical protein